MAISPLFDPRIQKLQRQLAEMAGRQRARAGLSRPAALEAGLRETRRALADMKPAEAGARPDASARLEENVAAGLKSLADMKPAEARPEAPTMQDAARAGAAQMPGNENRQPALHIAKNCLNGGEMSAQMGARFDQPRYQTGCHRLLNMVPMPCGGVTKRPGFVHQGFGGAENPQMACRLFPFVFSATEARMLEFFQRGDGIGLRVWLPDGSVIAPDLVLPWQGEWLHEICLCQSADVIFCACRHFAPAKLMRHADNDWRYETISWGPAIEPPERISISTGGTWPQGATEWMMRQYAVTSIDGEGNESAPREGFDIWGIPPLSDAFFVWIRVAAVEGAAEFRFYRKTAGVYGYVGRCEPAEDGTGYFEDRNITPDTADTPPRYKYPFKDEYPAVCFLHQQRLGFAATDGHPLTVWLSQTGNLESMAASVPPDDDDAIEATLAATQANRILWAQSDRTGLAIGTAGGEWLLAPSEGAALSPRDLSFQPQTSHGSQPFMPVLKTGSSLVFLQRGGCVLRDLDYSFQDDRYRSSDLSLLSRHILRGNPAQSWCWQPEPFGIIWCALRDGSMAGLTYLKEHDVIAWHRHKTGGKVECLAAIPDEVGGWQVWAAVARGGRRRIERLADFYEGEGEACHVDGLDGEPFEARCVPCIGEANVENGSTFLRCRKINAVKARVINSRPFRARVLSMNAGPSPTMLVPPRGGGFAEEADWACPVGAGFRDFARLELILDGPDPATILGLTVTMEFATEAGAQI